MSRDYNKEAKVAAEKFNIDFNTAGFSLDDLAEGIKVEYEHGRDTPNSITNVSDDDAEMTAKIAYRHLLERPDYYQLLDLVEHAPNDAVKVIKKIKAVLIVVFAVLVLIMTIMIVRSVGYEIKSPLKVARVR
ncbi:hypothetical protein D6_00411 [Faustovirus]|nr:hypothetical protein D6_00411 [Faustovirus]AMP44057.1 hypothetical protein PRJ_Dakar_00098 [Faustovirus]QKE50493.1 hypothetical protein F-VV10_0373 [Faustovirus]